MIVPGRRRLGSRRSGRARFAVSMRKHVWRGDAKLLHATHHRRSPRSGTMGYTQTLFDSSRTSGRAVIRPRMSIRIALRRATPQAGNRPPRWLPAGTAAPHARVEPQRVEIVSSVVVSLDACAVVRAPVSGSMPPFSVVSLARQCQAIVRSSREVAQGAGPRDEVVKLRQAAQLDDLEIAGYLGLAEQPLQR